MQLKTLAVEATRGVFGVDYPEADFRSLSVEMEYPMVRANYPGLWVDYAPTTPMQTAGIDHHEYVLDEDTSLHRRVGRWRYAGQLQFTVVALTSLERDRLLDEMTRVIAFGPENPQTAGFRPGIETNDLIACQVQWDRINLLGKAETPGTPWGTDEVVYEQTISVDCQGEFVASGGGPATLVALSAVVVFTAPQGEDLPAEAAGGGWV